MKITNVHVKRLTGLPRLLGTASVVFDDCFKVRDIFVLPKNKDELYIAMPSKKVRDNHWISMAYPINNEFKQEIQDAVLGEYRRLESASLPETDADVGSENTIAGDPEDE